MSQTMTASPKPADAESSDALDYMPRIDRNATNGISEAERMRDSIYALFENAAKAQRLKVLVLRSGPFVAPPWVLVECWARHDQDRSLTLRSSATIQVRPREFHRFPLECDVTLANDKKTRTIRNLIRFDSNDADAVLEYLLTPQLRRPPRFERCRTWGFDLWRPRNKTARLGVDVPQVAALVLCVLGFVTLTFGVGAILLLAAGILGYVNGLRRTHVLSAGKPSQEPRRLIRLDSWQVVVDRLGTERDRLRDTIGRELSSIRGQTFDVVDERIWYWGSDGKEEREQTVIRLRRGLLFLHLYSYGENLFVGWDAHVNCGKWIETIASKGFDKETKQLCAVHSIAAGWHSPNEYDIVDANCLIEQVHAIIARCLRLKIAEHQIDQEIDFTIVREARQNVVGRADPQGGAIAGMKSRLRRLG